MFASLEDSLWPHEILSRMQLSQIPHFQSQIFSNLVIICQSSHTLETHESYANPCTPWKLINTILHQNPSNLLPWFNPHKSCQCLFLEEFFIIIQTSSCPASFQKTTSFHWFTDLSLSTDYPNNFRPISNLNFISRMLKKASYIQSYLSSNSLIFPICLLDLSFYWN